MILNLKSRTYVSNDEKYRTKFNHTYATYTYHGRESSRNALLMVDLPRSRNFLPPRRSKPPSYLNVKGTFLYRPDTSGSHLKYLDAEWIAL